MAGIIRRNSAGAKWVYHRLAKRDQDQILAARQFIRECKQRGYGDDEIVELGRRLFV